MAAPIGMPPSARPIRACSMATASSSSSVTRGAYQSAGSGSLSGAIPDQEDAAENEPADPVRRDAGEGHRLRHVAPERVDHAEPVIAEPRNGRSDQDPQAR